MLRRIILALLVLLADLTQAIAQNTQSEIRPEVDGYVNLSPAVRLFLLALFTDALETGHWQGHFGVHFDVALKPVFRRELRSRDDVFRRRFLSFRAGYRYITSLGESRSPYLEHRWVVEATSRVPSAAERQPLQYSTRERGRPYLQPLFLMDVGYGKPAAPATRIF